jgi:hypothetical protein
VSPPGDLATDAECKNVDRLPRLRAIARQHRAVSQTNCDIERIAIERRERYASDENRHAVSRAAPRYRERLLFLPESGKIAADSLVIQNSQGLVVYFFPIPQHQVG